jgi:hypothetical protein
MKVVDLAKTGARDPRECLRLLIGEIDAGELVDDVVIVTASSLNGIGVRASGLNIGATPLPAMGLLQLGIAFLTAVCNDE